LNGNRISIAYPPGGIDSEDVLDTVVSVKFNEMAVIMSRIGGFYTIVKIGMLFAFGAMIYNIFLKNLANSIIENNPYHKKSA